MARTKCKQVVTSDIEFHRDSPPLLPLKMHRGLLINDLSEATHVQQDTLNTPISAGKNPRKHISKKQINVRSKIISHP